jgi:hypothetical protein
MAEVQQGGMSPENKKYIAADKNLWAGPLTRIIVNPADDLIL